MRRDAIRRYLPIVRSPARLEPNLTSTGGARDSRAERESKIARHVPWMRSFSRRLERVPLCPSRSCGPLLTIHFEKQAGDAVRETSGGGDGRGDAGHAGRKIRLKKKEKLGTRARKKKTRTIGHTGRCRCMCVYTYVCRFMCGA